jgi:hypothetical protein
MRFLTAIYGLSCLAATISAGASVASSPSSASSTAGNDNDQPPYLPGANITTSGNGCPQAGTDGKYLSATGSFAEMDFVLHNFSAVFGDGNSPSLKDTACEVHIDTIDAPADYQVSPTNFTAGGFAVLEPGTTLTVLITVFWSNNASNTVSLRSFRGIEGLCSPSIPAFLFEAVSEYGKRDGYVAGRLHGG